MQEQESIERMLVKAGYMTESQLARARTLTGDRRERERLRLLVELGYVSEENVLSCICRQEGLGRADLEHGGAESEAAVMLEGGFARDHLLLPAAVEKDCLLIAAPFWVERDTLEEAEALTGMRIVPVLAPAASLRAAIDAAYGEAREHGGGEREETRYACCMDADAGIYYRKEYGSGRIRAYALAWTEGERLTVFAQPSESGIERVPCP